MRVELVGVSQGVSFASGLRANSYFDFRTEDGKEFRVEVSEQAFQSVMAAVYGIGNIAERVAAREEPPPEISLPTPQYDPDASEFGGDAAEEQELLDEERQAVDDFVAEAEHDAPASEDEVPSL